MVLRNTRHNLQSRAGFRVALNGYLGVVTQGCKGCRTKLSPRPFPPRMLMFLSCGWINQKKQSQARQRHASPHSLTLTFKFARRRRKKQLFVATPRPLCGRFKFVVQSTALLGSSGGRMAHSFLCADTQMVEPCRRGLVQLFTLNTTPPPTRSHHRTACLLPHNSHFITEQRSNPRLRFAIPGCRGWSLCGP